MSIRTKAVGSLAALAAGFSVSLPGIAHAARKIADIEYARAGDQILKLDLYVPAAERAPLLVWLHGGRWEVGSKDRMPLTALVDRGYAVASLDFRPASTARFPGQVHDIKAALRFLRSQSARYGYDAARIGILGESSGGHLAALVGTTNGHPDLEGTLGEHLDTSSDVHAIVSYFGAADLMTILAQSTPYGVGVRTPALKTLLGSLPEENETLARLASPVFHVDASDPPLLLLHGDQDPQMPINQSHELEGAYERLGLDAKLIVVHGAGHGGAAFYDPERTALVAAFLDEHLRRELATEPSAAVARP
ncbi:MAG TPA: alpha/beta hydrolase fold domain-containing protein [Gammaproteobacteria bacterium]|nr:alpha/beta hydrolase fold domain-containing protein [Gammaproteobacteria bacterium]